MYSLICMENQKSFLGKIRTLGASQKSLLALVLILPAPIIGVLCSFYVPSLGKVVWVVAKVWLIILPVFWLLYIDRGKLSWSPVNNRGVLAGLIWSIPVSAAILGIYWIAKGSLINPEAKETIDNLGISSPAQFLIFASAMSLGNSLMEEYVWRWFVFSKFKVLVGVWPAIFLSAVFFTLHHVVIMLNFGSMELIIVGSLGLCIGGIVWGWLYQKYNSIWPGWICHVAADTAIMWITWTIIKGN